MTTRAADCAGCRHWSEGLQGVDAPDACVAIFGTRGPSDFRWWFSCAKHHRPRFYKPRDPITSDWGWKRRCEDYESREGK